MSYLTVPGQTWILRPTEYRLPGGVSSKLYPLEVIESVKIRNRWVENSALTNALSYYRWDTKAAEKVQTNPGSVSSVELNAVVSSYTRWPYETVKNDAGSVTSIVLDRVVVSFNAGYESAYNSPGTVTFLSLDGEVIVPVMYSTGLPEKYTITSFSVTEISLDA